jgi:uncharacterized glyoxalase superfamily metalloenzyme YdcJ
MEEQRSRCSKTGDNNKHQVTLTNVFSSFPDSWTALRKDQLAYFKYELTFQAVGPRTSRSLDELVSDGVVTAIPIVYEDFLPASAAGIFQSNLGVQRTAIVPGFSSKESFEEALGRKTIDYFSLYEAKQTESLERVRRITGCRV